MNVLKPFLNPKKLRKLQNNPQAFFKDALDKRIIPIQNQLKSFKPKKKNGFAEYYIISAVYNVEKYLDDYFNSILKQRLDFKNNITIICVDDGSTDNSAKIIQKYQKKFPKNIIYLHKENGGQASARNLGIQWLQEKLGYLEGTSAEITGEIPNYRLPRDSSESLAMTQSSNPRNDEKPTTLSLRGMNEVNDEAIHNVDNQNANNGITTGEIPNYRLPRDSSESLAMTQSKSHKPIWVTFTDPDDFLDRDYFYEVDKFLEENQNIHLDFLHCHTIHFMEKTRSYASLPCLEPMFFKNRKTTINNLKSTDALFFSNSFFFLKIQNLRFDEECKPNFEDGKFISEFLFSLDEHKSFAGFIASAKYFYRRPQNNANTLSKSLANPLKFTKVPRVGWLDVLQKAKNRYGFVPSYLQGTILWEVYWILELIINKEENGRHLNAEQKQEFLEICTEICRFIDIEYIQSHRALNHFYRLGIVEFFKQKRYPYEIAFFDNYNKNFNDFHFWYYSSNDDFNECKIYFDKKQVEPYYISLQEFKIFDKVFLYNKRVWVKVPQGAQEFEIFIRDKRANLEYKGLYYRKFFYVQKLINKATKI